MIVEGGKHYRVTMFASAMITVAFFILFVLFADVFPSNSPTWVVWLTLTCALGMGSGIGFAAQRWARVGVLIMGSVIGAFIGILLYNSTFYVVGTNEVMVLWLTIAISSVIVAVLSMVFFDYAVIVGSAIGGSYILVRVSI